MGIGERICEKSMHKGPKNLIVYHGNNKRKSLIFFLEIQETMDNLILGVHHVDTITRTILSINIFF